MAGRPALRRTADASEALAESDRRAAHVADVLKAVAHPLRLRIVAILCRGEENVSRLAATLGTPPAIVSQQLRILRLHHLVAVRRVGGFARYRLAEAQLRSLVSCMERCEGS
jgi:ArsR family transcriptional regulator